MQIIMRLLGALTTIYTILVFLRILLTWFEGNDLGQPYRVISQMTDPYLNWFRRFKSFQTEGMDFSPLIALAVLALTNNIFLTLGNYGRITVGIILSLALSSLWSAVAFILVFFIIVLAVRLIAYIVGANSVSPLWRILDVLGKPVLYRINRIIYRDRIVTFQTGLFTAILVLLGLRILGGLVIGLLSGLLTQLPF